MNKKAILISVDSFHDGGAEINAVRLANAFTKTRDVYFFELDSEASQKKDQLKLFNDSVKFCRPEKDFRFVIFQNLSRSRGIRRLLKLINYDIGISELKYWLVADFISRHNISVVNTHAPLSNAFFEKVKKRKQFKLVATLHGHYEVLKEELGKEKYQKFVSKHLYALDQFIYTTADQIKSLENFKVDEEKFSKVYYGFDFKPPQSEENKSKIQKCIIVSRGIREKGWEESIKAIIALNEKGYNLSLTIVGDGEEYDRLSHLEQRYSFLKFLGKRMDIPDILQEHDIALLPTYYRAESFPNSIIEYLSFGLPVITTTIGAIPEMIAFNDDMAGDTIKTSKGTPVLVEELSNVIQSYMDNPEKYTSKRKLAQKAALKFSIEISVLEYDKVFSKC